MRKIRGFTLAEVLITLTVIGIIAAISLPSLMQNVNERTWDTKRKALLSRMSAAISQIGDIGNYGKYETDDEGNVTDTMAESFVVEGLSKVYKIKNVCDSEHLDKCGFPSNFTNLQGRNMTVAKTGFSRKAASFRTTNGESLVVYYNPNCRLPLPTETTRTTANSMCVFFIYDLNGLDEPNEIGKDMGIMSAIYDTAQEPEVVAPNLYSKSLGEAPSYAEDDSDAESLCKKEGKNLSLPSLLDAMTIGHNTDLVSRTGDRTWTNSYKMLTGTIITPGKAGTVWYIEGGTAYKISRTTAKNVNCVKN